MTMRNAINTFVYGGVAPATGDIMSSFGDGSATFYMELFVFWGDLVQTQGEPLRPTMEAPGKLPVFPPDLAHHFVVKRRKVGGGPVADMVYVGRHEAFDDDGNYLGAVLVYTTGPISTDDSTAYEVAWSMKDSVTVNYGNDYLLLQNQPGDVSESFAAGD